MNKCFFFDRDGIINLKLENDYVKTIEEFVFIDDIFQILKQIKDEGYMIIIVTNQQGVGKGLMSENELNKIHNYMQNEIIKRVGFGFDAIYYCTDLAEINSYRRKPNPGMLVEAIDKFNINAEKSYIIGDSESDIIAGKKVGLKTIYIGSNQKIKADYLFDNHLEMLNNFKIGQD